MTVSPGSSLDSGSGSPHAENLRRLRQALATVEEAVFIVEPTERRIVWCNEAVGKVFLYSPDELTGRTTELLHVDRESFEEFAERTEPVLATGATFRGEFRMRRKDGKIFPSRHTITIVEESKGFRGGVVSVVRDLSSFHGALEALEESRVREQEVRTELDRSEHYFRALVEGSRDIITVLDPDGSIRYHSPAVEIWLGYRPDELLGTQAFDLAHPEDRPGLRDLFFGGVDDPDRTAIADFRLRSREGEWRTFQSWGVNLVHDPVVRGVIVYSRDVTEQRRVEQAMERHRERLRFAEKMESLGRLAGGIVHDFRNWLFLVMAHAELLAERVGPSEQRFVHEIRSATEQATALVQQLAIFGRQSSIQPERLDLAAVLQQMEPALARIAGEGVALTLRGPGEPLTALLDRGQLQQTILNLVNNAVDAMEGKGDLRLLVRRAELGPEEPVVRSGSFAQLTVEDSGPGVDEATRQRIFEPFFSTKKSGMGLGLATVFAFIHELGGTIELASGPGEGARFELLIPLDE